MEKCHPLSNKEHNTKKDYEKKYKLNELLCQYWLPYLNSPSRSLKIEPKHKEAANKIQACRTEKLGIFKLVCTGCGEVKYVYRSCKHRFCCTCGIIETNKWAKERLENLLKIKHHHVVMTLPSPLRILSKMNGDKIHNLLFKTSGEVLQNFYKERHGLKCGIVSVLHTSGSDLKYHPHVHMIVSSGGITLNSIKTAQQQLIELESDWLCDQHHLARKFRGLFIKRLLDLYDKEDLKIYKKLADRMSFMKWLNKLGKNNWIVSIQDPLSDAEDIIRYVGRYTKRACISEYKIELVADDKITFRYNDYKNTPRGEKPKQGLKTMHYIEFLDALFQHVPNKRFRMVRYYGLYNSRNWKTIPDEFKNKKLKSELDKINKKEELEKEDWGEFEAYRKKQIELTGQDPLHCYHCKKDLIIFEIVAPTAKKGIKRIVATITNLDEYENSS